MGGPGKLNDRFEGTQGGREYKAKIAPKRGKEKDDVQSWAKGERPYVGESGKEFAKRIMDARYGKGNYDKGADTEFSKLQKYGDTHFEKDKDRERRLKR